MRPVAVLLLLTALASMQLPWVLCEAEQVHLDVGHDGEPDHQPLEWSATPHAGPTPLVAGAFLQICVREPITPDAGTLASAPEARAVAPPIAARLLTTVLLL